MTGRAVLSPDGLYRYTLEREWQAELGPVPTEDLRCLFVMLNPSTADAFIDDPTIRRCVGFARSWGYSSLSVVNLFALRATHPGVLRVTPNPVGPDNDDWIRREADRASLIVAAWGTSGDLLGRDRSVLAALDRHPGAGDVYCLGVTRSGQPLHPLYVAGATVPSLYVRPARLGILR